MTRGRRLLVLVGGTAAGLVAAFALTHTLSTSASGEHAIASVRGQELIDELDLPTVQGDDSSCFAKLDFDGVLYCLDPAASTEAEAMALADRIRGGEPATPQELELDLAQVEWLEAHAAVEAAVEAGDEEALAEANAELVRAADELLRQYEALESGDASTG